MALVLSGDGLVRVRARRQRARSHRSTSPSPRRRAKPSRHAREGRNLLDADVDGGATLAEVVAADGSVTRSDPGSLPLLDPGEGPREARTGSTVRGAVNLQRPIGDWRYLAVPSEGGTSQSSRARSSRARSRCTGCCASCCSPAPLALLLASLAGYGLAAAALRPVEAMRRRAAAVSAHDARPAAGTRERATRSRDSRRR